MSLIKYVKVIQFIRIYFADVIDFLLFRIFSVVANLEFAVKAKVNTVQRREMKPFPGGKRAFSLRKGGEMELITLGLTSKE